MIPYIVYAPPYHTGSGGIVVMHRLMNELVKRYPNHVFTNQPIQNKKWEGVPLLEELEEGKDTIVIYPEIITGNPFGSKTVVRYILNVPGFYGGPTAFGNDFIFVYSDYWKRQSGLNLPDSRILYIPDLIESEWPNRGLERGYNLWYRGKGNQPEDKFITDNAIFIGSNQELTEEKQDWLRDMMSGCKIFFTYDVATAMISIAIFSGCEVGIVEDPTRELIFPLETTEEGLRDIYRRDEERMGLMIENFVSITQGDT